MVIVKTSIYLVQRLDFYLRHYVHVEVKLEFLLSSLIHHNSLPSPKSEVTRGVWEVWGNLGKSGDWVKGRDSPNPLPSPTPRGLKIL
jgi:hypothetical protein